MLYIYMLIYILLVLAASLVLEFIPYLEELGRGLWASTGRLVPRRTQGLAEAVAKIFALQSGTQFQGDFVNSWFHENRWDDSNRFLLNRSAWVRTGCEPKKRDIP